MEQYISKSAIVSEIKKRMKVHMESNHGFSARYDELKDILSFIDTIEVKNEKDFEKEFFDWYHEEKNRDYNASILYERYGTTSKKLAKHFFELGMAVNEYIRKDAFMKKVFDAYCKVCGHYAHSVPTYICRHDCRYFSDFKRIMKGE